MLRYDRGLRGNAYSARSLVMSPVEARWRILLGNRIKLLKCRHPFSVIGPRPFPRKRSRPVIDDKAVTHQDLRPHDFQGDV